MFKDLLNEAKGLKYQITVKVLLSKHKENGGIEFAPVYFNFTTKKVISSEYDLEKFLKKLCTGSIIGLMKDLVA